LQLYCKMDGTMVYIHRTIEKAITDASNTFPVLLLTGPRQVGKTTILRHLALDQRKYVSLDSPSIRALAVEDPALFMQTYPPPILIDEIQYAPELFSYIKIIVDKDRKPGMFWLTGSQQFHLMRNVSESLAGRIAILRLLGLSLREELGHANESLPFLPDREIFRSMIAQDDAMNVQELYKRIWRGSYPDLITNPKINWELFYDSYTQSYIQRDVKDLVKIIDDLSFLTFLRATAARTGQLLNYNDLSKDLSVSVNTVKSWISILQASGIIYLLEPYSNNKLKRMIKAPKLYFIDTGLCCFLAAWPNHEVLANSAMAGAMLETYVVSEIIKSYWHNGRRANIFFYRDKDLKEIDLLIEENGMLYPIEIKKNSTPNKRMIASFSCLNKLELPVGHGALICLAEEFLPLNNNVDVIPVGAL
jgi:predicted AAA+ superfamily ATPase